MADFYTIVENAPHMAPMKLTGEPSEADIVKLSGLGHTVVKPSKASYWRTLSPGSFYSDGSQRRYLYCETLDGRVLTGRRGIPTDDYREI